jgi:hypothetical protein
MITVYLALYSPKGSVIFDYPYNADSSRGDSASFGVAVGVRINHSGVLLGTQAPAVVGTRGHTKTSETASTCCAPGQPGKTQDRGRGGECLTTQAREETIPSPSAGIQTNTSHIKA